MSSTASIIIPTGRVGALNRWGETLYRDGWLAMLNQVERDLPAEFKYITPEPSRADIMTIYTRFPTPAYGRDLSRNGKDPMSACNLRLDPDGAGSGWSEKMFLTVNSARRWAENRAATLGIFHGLATATDDGMRRVWMTPTDFRAFRMTCLNLVGMGFRAHMLDAPEHLERWVMDNFGVLTPEVQQNIFAEIMASFYAAADIPGCPVVAENPAHLPPRSWIRPHTTVKAGDWTIDGCKGMTWADREGWTHILHDPSLVEAWRGGMMRVPNPCISLPKLLGEVDDE